MRISGQHRELIEPRAAGARENLVVVRGKLELTVGGEQPIVLPEGDAAAFHADVERSYRNLDGGDTVIHIVVTYVEPVGGSPGVASDATFVQRSSLSPLPGGEVKANASLTQRTLVQAARSSCGARLPGRAVRRRGRYRSGRTG